MNPFKGLYEAIRNFIRALGRAADAFDSLADDVEKRHVGEDHATRTDNGLKTGRTTVSKVKT